MTHDDETFDSQPSAPSLPELPSLTTSHLMRAILRISAPQMPAWNDAPARLQLAASRTMSRRVNAQPQECWRNSVLAGGVYGAKMRGLAYHEGIVLTPIAGALLPIEHGWLEATSTGAVFDVTLPLVASSDDELRASVYVSMFAWPVDDVRDAVMRAGARGLTLPFSGMGGAALGADARERYAETWRHVFALLDV